MSLPSNLYEQAFANSPPKQTVTLLKARLLASENAAESLSRYVEERSAIESDYAKKLSKLASRPILPDGTGFADIVTQIEAELSSAVQSHSTFASKLENTVAAPLRDSSRAGAERVKSYAGDANAIANEHDSISQKVAKAASKFGASSKKQAQLASNQDDLSTALAGWLNAAPNYLKAVQHADKARLDAIKENMAKYETLVSDLGRERMETGPSIPRSSQRTL
jgi:ABC-type transporter Mla subunit MlaD